MRTAGAPARTSSVAVEPKKAAERVEPAQDRRKKKAKKARKKAKRSQAELSAKKAAKAKTPKKKCCQDKPRCTRCPLRMLDEGTLPPGYGVRHRRLVKLDDSAA